MPGYRVPSHVAQGGPRGAPGADNGLIMMRERAAQIPDSGEGGRTLAAVTSPPEDSRWQRPGSSSLVDPEDDLPSDTYGGDFETTAIPPYQGSPGSASSGMDLLREPEPLPYVEPAGGVFEPAGPVEIGVIDDEQVRAAGRRGTQDLGLLVLRVGFGALLIAHGLHKIFGWWGGDGLSGLRDSLTEMGYQHANILSYVAAGTEITAGVLLVLGLFTPLAAAAALAYLVNALLAGVSADGGRNLAFFLPDGHEYELMLIVVATAIVLAGPGRYGFDAGRGWARRPFIGSFLALLLGIGVGIGIWALLNGANPLA